MHPGKGSRGARAKKQKQERNLVGGRLPFIGRCGSSPPPRGMLLPAPPEAKTSSGPAARHTRSQAAPSQKHSDNRPGVQHPPPRGATLPERTGPEQPRPSRAASLLQRPAGPVVSQALLTQSLASRCSERARLNAPRWTGGLRHNVF